MLFEISRVQNCRLCPHLWRLGLEAAARSPRSQQLAHGFQEARWWLRPCSAGQASPPESKGAGARSGHAARWAECGAGALACILHGKGDCMQGSKSYRHPLQTGWRDKRPFPAITVIRAGRNERNRGTEK